MGGKFYTWGDDFGGDFGGESGCGGTQSRTFVEAATLASLIVISWYGLCVTVKTFVD